MNASRFVTTPLLLMDLLLTAGVPWPTIAWTIFMDEAMIITGLIGALTPSRWKWGWWTFGTAAMFYVFYNLAFEGRKRAKALGDDVSRVYTMCGVLTLGIWMLYPIAWGVSEGGNVISPDSEAVFYGVLDFCAKPIFSIMLIVGHWNIDPERLGLTINYGDAGPSRPMKKAHNEGSTGPGVTPEGDASHTA
jgi:bacteriorhodopsin